MKYYVVNFFSLVGKYVTENNLGNIDEDVEFNILREVRNAKLKHLKNLTKRETGPIEQRR